MAWIAFLVRTWMPMFNLIAPSLNTIWAGVGPSRCSQVVNVPFLWAHVALPCGQKSDVVNATIQARFGNERNACIPYEHKENQANGSFGSLLTQLFILLHLFICIAPLSKHCPLLCGLESTLCLDKLCPLIGWTCSALLPLQAGHFFPPFENPQSTRALIHCSFSAMQVRSRMLQSLGAAGQRDGAVTMKLPLHAIFSWVLLAPHTGQQRPEGKNCSWHLYLFTVPSSRQGEAPWD